MMLRLAILLSLLCSTSFAAIPLELTVTGISGNSVSTTEARNVDVVIANVHSDEPVVFASISVERKNPDGTYSWFRPDIGCPCGAKCKKELITLRKSESREAAWDFLGGHHCEKAETGTYRFAVTGNYSDDASGNVYLGISRDFSVTN